MSHASSTTLLIVPSSAQGGPFDASGMAHRLRVVDGELMNRSFQQTAWTSTTSGASALALRYTFN
ncbi:MAG: hypothetical protein R2712_23325 [Vicinamibacterales bacterium]